MTADTVLSIMVLACLALVLGALALWRRSGQHKQVALMLVLAAIVAANVAMWVVPDQQGKTLIGQDVK